MRCPFCNHPETQVKDSRPAEESLAIRRRRYCTECGTKFSTVERHFVKQLFVVKKNGQRVAFSRDKLTRSLGLCLRKRPISSEAIEKLVNKVVRKLESHYDHEVQSRVIGEYIMQDLKKLDNVAYIRYASVYMDFTDSKDFQNMINSLNVTPQPEPQV